MTHVHRVAALLLFLAACGKGENRSPDSAAGLSAASNAAATQQQPQRRFGPGDLTKPLAQYTGDELNALVQSLQYVGGVTRDRRCRDLPGCGGANPTVRTRINLDGIVGEDSVVPSNVAPFGTIVSRARNLGGAPDAMYGMRPGNRYQYFLIVLPDTGGTARWQIEQLETVGNNRTHAPLMSGRLTGCNHPFRAGARANFQTCAQAALRDNGSLVQFASLMQDGDPPWWFACGMGCCLTGN